MRRPVTSVLGSAALVASSYVSAHHSFAAEFDGHEPVRLIGTITRIQWTNPHSYFYLDVQDSKGDIKFGDKLIVDGYLAKDGSLLIDLPGYRLPLTPAGETALKHNLTATIDPEALCIIGGIPRHSASALPFEIVQNKNRVVFLYMYTYFRSVPVDGRQHMQDPDPSFFGDKVGRWEGDTLVIDTVALKDNPIWIDENANPQSDAMHSIDRWTRPDADHLHLELTVDDPKYYTHPFNYSRTWLAGKPGEELKEYSCSENNIDREHLGPGPGPIRPDGTRGYNVPALPDLPPPPEAYVK